MMAVATHGSRWLALVAALLLGGIGAACVTTPGAERDTTAAAEIRVLVYNIHAGRDAAGEDNLAAVAELVRGTRADLVLLQEVDRGTERSGGVDQLGELERRTGFHGAFGKTLDYQGGGYGIALLSRWPIASHALHPLAVEPAQERAGGSYEPRGALAARVDGPTGAVGVVNTHLDASADDVYRRQEVVGVLSAAERLRAEAPRTVVGGDFNAEPGTATIERMRSAGWTDAWGACGGDEGLTFSAETPVKRIDYLFLAPGLSCTRAEVLATRASDHLPLLVVLRASPLRESP